MSLRCKKGDLAMVLFPPYEGCFVTCMEFLGRVHVIGTDGHGGWVDNCWETTFPGDMKAARGTNGKCAIPDEQLLPIRPGDLKETEETEKEVESV